MCVFARLERPSKKTSEGVLCQLIFCASGSHSSNRTSRVVRYIIAKVTKVVPTAIAALRIIESQFIGPPRIASSVPVSAGFSDRKQTGPFVSSQFTFVRCGRPRHAKLRRTAGAHDQIDPWVNW